MTYIDKALHCARRLISGALLVSAIAPTYAQEFPTKLIRIVTSPPGGSNDLTARLIVKGLTEKTGWQLIVDNRPTVVAPEVVMRAAPDGYTLLVSGGTFNIGHLLAKLPYDPVSDFTPISLTHRQPFILVVHPSLPVKSVKELIALAKTRPGQLNYGSSGTGSSSHLAAELFNVMAGVKTVRVNYKGTGMMANAILSGEVQLAFVVLAGISGYLESGRLRPIAIASAEPSPLYPRLPTVGASGLPGFVAVGLTSVFGPAGMAAPVVNRLNQEIVRALNLPGIKDQFTSLGIDTVGSSPQDLAAAMKADISRTARIIKEAAIRVE